MTIMRRAPTLALLVLGCASCALRYAPPVSHAQPQPLPADLVPPTPPASIDGTTAVPRVEREARTVTLHEVLERARQDALSVLAAESDLRIAKARSQEAGGRLLPTAELYGRARYLGGREQGNFGQEQPVAFWRFDPAIGLAYDLNLGAEIHRASATARNQDAAALDIADARRRAMYSAATAYHDLSLARAAMSVATTTCRRPSRRR